MSEIVATLTLVLVPFAAGVAVSRVRAWKTGVALVSVCTFGWAFSLRGLELPTALAGLLSLPLSITGFSLGLLCGPFLGVSPGWSAGGLCLLCVFSIGSAAAGGVHPVRRQETVTTSTVVGATPEVIWGSLKGFGQLEGRKSLLFEMGLPVPVRCVLERDGVNARRVCIFDKGRIEQRVTRWEPPLRFDLEIIETDLPGHPFGFTSATYELRAQGSSTAVTRTTTLSSQLSPGWFWRPLESLTVRAEHDYLLGELDRRFRQSK